MSTFREISKKDWSTLSTLPTHDDIQSGCMQRMADALELVAKRYSDLINEVESYKQYWKEAEARNSELYRRNAGLRGYIKRLKVRKGSCR